MKTLAILLMLSVSALCMNVGCAREVSHTETSHPNILGGQTTSEQTTVQHADGTYSTERSKTSTH